MRIKRLGKGPILIALGAFTLCALADEPMPPSSSKNRVVDSHPRNGDGSAAATEKLTEDLEKKQETEQKHPRRTEVDAKTRHAEKRVRTGQRDGTISPAEAKKLNSELDAVKVEEHSALDANGGSLTPANQQGLDEKLRKESKELRLDRANKEH